MLLLVSSKTLALQLSVMFICISRNSCPQILSFLVEEVSNLALKHWQHYSVAFPLVKHHPSREMTHSRFFILGDKIKYKNRGIFISEVKASIGMNLNGIK